MRIHLLLLKGTLQHETLLVWTPPFNLPCIALQHKGGFCLARPHTPHQFHSSIP